MCINFFVQSKLRRASFYTSEMKVVSSFTTMCMVILHWNGVESGTSELLDHTGKILCTMQYQ